MNDFNPDELQLTKKDILRIIVAVQKRWRRNGWKNRIYLAGLSVFKAGINFTPDTVLEVVWRDMVSLTNKMIEYNGMKRMCGEFPTTEGMLSILEKEIESGEFVGEPNE